MASSLNRMIIAPIRNLHPLFVAVFLFLLCLASYSNSFNNGFLMDDYPMLIKNPNITNPEFMKIDFSNRGGVAYFRPVHNVITFFTFRFFADRPAGYHLVNLALFYLACLALYRLLTAVLKQKPLAFLTVALFAAHPINSIVVDYKNATYFGALLISMTLGILATVRNTDKPFNMLRELPPLVFCAIALSSHEVAVAYPMYLAAILYFGCGRTFRESFLRVLPCAFLTGAYILFRSLSVKKNVLGNMHLSFFEYTASLAKAVTWYLGKLIGLDGIIMAKDTTALASQIVIFNILAIFTVLMTIFWASRTRKDDPRLLAVIWFVCGLFPLALACVSRPLFGFAMQPHWMLFGSIGFFLFVATTLRQLGNTVNRQVWVAAVMIIMVAYVLHTRHYNYLWGTQERYCRHWLTVDPHSSWASYWLAYDRMEQGDHAQAEHYFQKAIKGSVADVASYANLAYIKRVQGRLTEAVSDYENALRLNPSDAQSHFWLGYVHWQLHNIANAEVCFQRAVKLDGSLADAVKKVKFSPRQ